MIKGSAEIKVDKTYRGIVRGIKEFVECLPGKEGIVQISTLADFRAGIRVRSHLLAQRRNDLKCINIEKSKVRLPRKAALEDAKDPCVEGAPTDEDANTTDVE